VSTSLSEQRQTVKHGRAINGDRFRLRHNALDLSAPFTTFIDASFRGTTHQVFAAADRRAFNYEHVTGEFTVAGFSGFLLEALDSVETQVAHRYQALVDTPAGVLSTHSYDSTAGLLAFVGALRPEATDLGVILDPDDEVEFTTAPRVALTLDIGVLEITPLTAEVIDQLPSWQGTEVSGGQLYGGQLDDTAIYLTLVTPTCRVVALPAADASEDEVATALASLQADWQA
jgi:hypothetical protein